MLLLTLNAVQRPEREESFQGGENLNDHANDNGREDLGRLAKHIDIFPHSKASSIHSRKL